MMISVAPGGGQVQAVEQHVQLEVGHARHAKVLHVWPRAAWRAPGVRVDASAAKGLLPAEDAVAVRRDLARTSSELEAFYAKGGKQKCRLSTLWKRLALELLELLLALAGLRERRGQIPAVSLRLGLQAQAQAICNLSTGRGQAQTLPTRPLES